MAPRPAPTVSAWAVHLVVALLFCFHVLAGPNQASAASFTNFCNQLASYVTPCTSIAPRDLLFVVDASFSQNQTLLNEDVLSFVQQLYCGVDTEVGSQVGLIIFGYDVKVWIGLAARTTDEWANAVEAIKGQVSTTGGTSNTPANTPTAEALQLALAELQLHGNAANVKTVIIVTDGQPYPIPNCYSVNPWTSPTNDPAFPFTGYPYAARYYPWTYDDTGNPTTSVFDYLTYILPEAAAALKAYNKTHVMMLREPTLDGNFAPLEYFQGLGYSSCTPTPTTATDGGYTWPNASLNYCDTLCTGTTGSDCATYCFCATVSQPLVTDPATDIFTTLNVRLQVTFPRKMLPGNKLTLVNSTTSPTWCSSPSTTHARPSRRPNLRR